MKLGSIFDQKIASQIEGTLLVYALILIRTECTIPLDSNHYKRSRMRFSYKK